MLYVFQKKVIQFFPSKYKTRRFRAKLFPLQGKKPLKRRECHAIISEFESSYFGLIAQWIEHPPSKRVVAGSNPAQSVIQIRNRSINLTCDTP